MTRVSGNRGTGDERAKRKEEGRKGGGKEGREGGGSALFVSDHVGAIGLNGATVTRLSWDARNDGDSQTV